MAAVVDVRVTDRVATVTVDNPPVNSLDDATLGRLREVAAELAAADDVRAVVVTGAGGRVFLAGADLREFRAAMARPGAMEEHVALSRPTFDAWSALPQPVIAAVAGSALGGGLEFALVCDFVVADRRARFGLPEVTLGLIPGAGGTQRLPRRIGRAVASELLLLGAPVDAERAREVGLVTLVSEPGAVHEDAAQLAARLAALPSGALRAAKRAARDATEGGISAGLDVERKLFLSVAASVDAREGVDAFLEKRAPRFD